MDTYTIKHISEFLAVGVFGGAMHVEHDREMWREGKKNPLKNRGF